MKTITRSIWGSSLQTSLLLGQKPTILEHSTLNEKHGILVDEKLGDAERPAMQYYCIGNGGHKNMVGADGAQYTSPIPHRAWDAALYRQLPFVLRRVDNDLDPVARQRYGLRKLVNIGGVNYFAYYLKRISMANTAPAITHTIVNGSQKETEDYVPTLANLNPQPPAMSNTGVITTSGDYLSTSQILTLVFTAEDVLELINACRILYDNEAYAVISEIGMVSGVDRNAQVQGPGNTTFNMKEVICAQIASFITTHHSVAFTNKGFSQDIELGATEPLLSDSNYVSANNG
ncbi:hypothetical protein [Streptomyces sp. CHB9.2]|uniref:DUF7208 family protein n=1 Tax=Streptomyces sp. CHB9.2 TaxID=2841670 RepID=UPI002095A037|nr:hypothetical protein [Streptomyces sp. CHB9.2]MCO6704809.1 hypothetical protein [Streptomyces sp. CHB9.2]